MPNKVLIGDIFDTSRGNVISEEEIYQNFEKNGIPVYSSQTENNGCIGTVTEKYYNKSNKKGEANTLTWTTDGANAGKVFFRNNKYLYTNVCGKLKQKNFNYNINLEYICLILNCLTKKERNSVNSNPKLMSNQIEKIKIYLPSIEEQNAVVEKYKKLEQIRTNILLELKKINTLYSYTTIFAKEAETIKMEDVFEIKTGTRIIESDIYKYKGSLPCVTSQTINNGIAWYGDENWLKNNFKDKIIDEKECITWSKDGNAGKLFYRNYKFYPNDHCGVLILKPEFLEKVNLKWFFYTMEPYIKENVSQKNSQPMLYNSAMKNIRIPYPFPPIEEQNAIIELYDKLSNIKNNLENILSQIPI
ncbi:restriction endonuclease subunit S [uncultured Tyzzerella sp.]|uniref:restriction endonuclease subunit S n=1 Tax=uncultured Tyzzerella sp. TaxID=2321398 RepID=UPI002943F539|nr:restriction endonuclease subunit S [uncultured Tyzzerella sp.]